MPDNHKKEYLSKSYLSAVVAQAGYICQMQEQDYGVDAVISEIQELKSGKLVSSGFQFDVQLKSTHIFTKNKNDISYALEAEAFNKLISRRSGLIVLVLFCVPELPADRLILSEDCLELRNCCYWFIVSGDLTENTASKTIHIPRNQIFNPENCRNLMEYAKLENM